MSKKEKQQECKAGAPEWMTTYGDLVTLLMCFFVLLFAFSSIDAQKFEAVMQSFQGSAGVLQSGKSLSDAEMIFDAMPEDQVAEQVESVDQLEILKEIVEQYLEKNNLKSDVLVELDSRGLLLRFKENTLFDSGKAELRNDSLKTLDFLGQILLTEEFVERYVRVEGHTDNVPINTVKFPSNWELSTSRATSVVRFFIEKIKMKPERFSASGYGEYFPVANNETADGRQQNRRVDIVILRELELDEAPLTQE